MLMQCRNVPVGLQRVNMEANEDSCESLPYIDDGPTDDETTPHQYSLEISENYRDKNRKIEITDRLRNDVSKYFGPVKPPAEEPETETRRHMRSFTSSGMKLVIRGWNSSISIQGLDNKSSITLKRRCEKLQKKEGRDEERTSRGNAEEPKPRRGRWKMLTKSLMMARSARFERKGPDERYPKYVLLKNEDDDMHEVRESYPKMFVFNESKQKANSRLKTEFNLKKSFKNKTEPIVPLEEVLSKTGEGHDRRPTNVVRTKQKLPLTDRNHSQQRNLMMKKRFTAERKKTLKSDEQSNGQPQAFVCSEIQGIFEDTLKLLPHSLEAQQRCCGSIPPQLHHFPCPGVPDRTPKYIPMYPPPKHVHENTMMAHTASENVEEEDVGPENLPFGLLSGFFPRVVIMDTIRQEELEGGDRREGVTLIKDFIPSMPDTRDGEPQKEDEPGASESLQIPEQDLSMKSKLVRQPVKAEAEDSLLSDVSQKESPSSEEELGTKTQESEATTEYLQYGEFFEQLGNESADREKGRMTPPPRYEKPEKVPSEEGETQREEEYAQDFSLTKIGYKMYDNLTKLSLNREKDTMKRAEASGCGCNGNEAKKSPYNITFESSSSVVKVTVPENELNFQIVNSLGADIQIGVTSHGRGSAKKESEKENEEKKDEEEDEGKKIVRKEELWHLNGGGRAVVLQNDGTREAAFQRVKVSLGDDKAVVLSIAMSERDKKEEEEEGAGGGGGGTKEKGTKEMKVGTDDFDLAGGDFVCSSGGSFKNLSPRIGRLLKRLHEKLESDERERKYLEEKMKQKLLNHEAILPGVFLVKHISPRNQVVARKPAQSPAFEKTKKVPERQERTGQLREYYCEECLATLRMFEDENPSVKSMVDKFETIIQLESY